MTDEEAFLRAIQATPDDDTLRLVFADWLQETGDSARAEFIRLQHRVELLPPGPERSAIEDHTDELLALHEMDWLGPVGQLHSWEWRRGFVERVSGGPRPTLEAARGLFERNPVRVVGFGTVCWWLNEMVELPFLERIEELCFDVGDEPQNRSILLDFLASPRLARLRELDISTGGDTGGVLADLATRSAIPPLSAIKLREVTFDDADALVRASNLRGLTDVGGFDGVPGAALARLLEVPDRWTGLDLGFGDLLADDLGGLARCGRLRRLVFRWPRGQREPIRLPSSVEDLEVCAVRGEGPPPSALARTLAGTRLRHLQYRWEPAGGVPTPGDWNGLGELLAGLPGPVLDLTLSGFTKDPLPLFARLPGLQNVRRLSVSMFPRSDAGADAIAECASLTGLREFESEIGWTAEQSRRLAGAPFLSGLRKLRFQGPVLGDECAAAFLRSPGLQRLRALEWLEARVGAETVEALAAWPGLVGLRCLCLHFNPLQGAVVQPLVERLGVRFSHSLPVPSQFGGG